MSLQNLQRWDSCVNQAFTENILMLLTARVTLANLDFKLAGEKICFAYSRES